MNTNSNHEKQWWWAGIGALFLFLAVAGWVPLAEFIAGQPSRRAPEIIGVLIGQAFGITILPLVAAVLFRKHFALVLVAGTLLCFVIFMAQRKPGENLFAGPAVTQVTAPANATASSVQTDAPPIAASQWETDVATFVASRCDLDITRMTTPRGRAWVAENLRLFQRALNEEPETAIPNAELLKRAGERLYTYPGYLPRGFCPTE